MVTVEQNVAIKTAIRSDLRYIVPGVPTRYFYQRGAVPVRRSPPPPGTDVEPIPPAPVPCPCPAEPVVDKLRINIASAASHVIIRGASGYRIKIFYLTLTVGGDVNITFYDGANAFSGAMDFGGASEPRGIVMPHDGIAVPLDVGNDFKILLSAAVQVSGFVVYSYIDPGSGVYPGPAPPSPGPYLPPSPTPSTPVPSPIVIVPPSVWPVTIPEPVVSPSPIIYPGRWIS